MMSDGFDSGSGSINFCLILNYCFYFSERCKDDWYGNYYSLIVPMH